jgi:hypothetical protein
MQAKTDRTKKQQPRRRRAKVILALAAAASVMTGASVMAASQTWTGGGNDGLWSTGANWSGGAMPGAINTLPNTVSNDVATFNGPVGGAARRSSSTIC